MYNGYTNWDTWCLDLWVGNNEDWYLYCRESSSPYDLEKRIYEFKHLITDKINFNEVNYNEIYNFLI